MLSLRAQFPSTWCIAGDFNTVRCIEEKQGCITFGIGIDDFNVFINLCELTDLPLIDKRFTWYGTDSKFSRLDHFFSLI
ncbi:hypothetical protein QUC31_019259 [Theobroma cacao]